MALKGNKKQGGQGGRCGHSNMSHYTGTEDIKLSAKKRGRRESKELVREGLWR